MFLFEHCMIVHFWLSLDAEHWPTQELKEERLREEAERKDAQRRLRFQNGILEFADSMNPTQLFETQGSK